MPSLLPIPPLPLALAPLAAIAMAFVLVALAERRFAARPAAYRRWPVNLGLGVLNALVVRAAAALGPVAAALWAGQAGWGLFHLVTLPGWLVIMLAVMLMDLALYLQHRALHRLPWGWALHKLHHADTAMDVSTAVRFNPAEAVVSMLYKSALTLILGLPVAAVLLFEAWLAVGSMIEHGNIRLSPRADAAIRRIWVTPAMHAVHHSAHGDDHNHNYGFALAIWDHLLGTHRAAASGGQLGLPTPAPAG